MQIHNDLIINTKLHTITTFTPLSTPHGIHSAAINHNHTILADRRPTHHTPHLTTKTDNKTSNTDTENNLHHLIKKQEWWARRDF
jgi:hypothetical protein